jgi:hypothetical protein
MPEQDYLDAIRAAGFAGVKVVSAKRAGDLFGAAQVDDLLAGAPGTSAQELRRLGDIVVSVEVKAAKPQR